MKSDGTLISIAGCCSSRSPSEPSLSLPRSQPENDYTFLVGGPRLLMRRGSLLCTPSTPTCRSGVIMSTAESKSYDAGFGRTPNMQNRLSPARLSDRPRSQVLPAAYFARSVPPSTRIAGSAAEARRLIRRRAGPVIFGLENELSRVLRFCRAEMSTVNCSIPKR